MNTFVIRLTGSRPTFAVDASAAERAVMARHAEYWRPRIEAGELVVFGPVMGDNGSFGLAVVETDDDEETLRAFCGADPAATTGTGTFEISRLLTGFVRGR